MDKYEKVRVLGKGSFGSAILIKRKTDDALFVVKEIPLEHLNRKERAEARKECSVLQRLQHPNIVQYIEHFENNNCLYLVMEYCDDSDLSEKVKECHGPMKESCILFYFSQVCLAVKYLHSKHILHRDIKTMNVFLMRNGTVKIGDFGIAIMLRNTMALAKTVCGTPYYFSPELCKNRPYNSKSDMWSLGILLYECATGGRHPFDGSNMSQLMHRIVKTPHKPISDTCYSLELRNLVDWCLKKEPTRRPSILQVLAYPLVWKSMETLEEKLLFATSHHLGLRDLLDETGSSNDIDSSLLGLPSPPTFSSGTNKNSKNALEDLKKWEAKILYPKSDKDAGIDLVSHPSLSLDSAVPSRSTLPVVSITTTAPPISNDCSGTGERSSPTLFHTGVCNIDDSNIAKTRDAEMVILPPSSLASDRSKTANFGPASQTAKPSEISLSSDAQIKTVEKLIASDQVSPFIHTADGEVLLQVHASAGPGHDKQEFRGECNRPGESLLNEVIEVASELRNKEFNTDACQEQSKKKQPEEVVHGESDTGQKLIDEVEEKKGGLAFIVRGGKAVVMKNIQAKVMRLQELQKNISREQKVRKRITGKAWRPHPQRKRALIPVMQSNHPSIPSGVSPCCSLKVDTAGSPNPSSVNSVSKGVVTSSLPFPSRFVHDNSSRTNPYSAFHKNSPRGPVEKKRLDEGRREGSQSVIPMPGVPGLSTRHPVGTSHSISSTGRRTKWNHSKKAKQAYRSPYAQPFRHPSRDIVGRNAAVVVPEWRQHESRSREIELHKVLPSSVSYLPIHARSSSSSSSSCTLTTSTFSSCPPLKGIDANHPFRVGARNDKKHPYNLSPLPPRRRWRELKQASSFSSRIKSSKNTSKTLFDGKAAAEEKGMSQKERPFSNSPLVVSSEHTSTPVRKGGRGSGEQRKGMLCIPALPQSIRVRDLSVTKRNSTVLSSSFVFPPSPTTTSSLPMDHPSTSFPFPITASTAGFMKEGRLSYAVAITEEEHQTVLVGESHRSSSIALLPHSSRRTSSIPRTSDHGQRRVPTCIRPPPPTSPPWSGSASSPPSPLSSSSSSSSHPLRVTHRHERHAPRDAFLPASSSRSFTCPPPPRVYRSAFPSTPFSSPRVLERIQSSRHPRWPLSPATYRHPFPPDRSLRPWPLLRRPLSTPQQRPASPSPQAVLLSPISPSSGREAVALDVRKSFVPSSDASLPDDVVWRGASTLSWSCATFLQERPPPPPVAEDGLRPPPFSPLDPNVSSHRPSPPARYGKGMTEKDRSNPHPSTQEKKTTTSASSSSSSPWMHIPPTVEASLFLPEKKKGKTKGKKKYKVEKEWGVEETEEAHASPSKAKENTVLRVLATPPPSTTSSPPLALPQEDVEDGGRRIFPLPSPLHTSSSPSSSIAVELASQLDGVLDHTKDEGGAMKTGVCTVEEDRRGRGGGGGLPASPTIRKSRSIPFVEVLPIVDLPPSLKAQKKEDDGGGSNRERKKKLRAEPIKDPLLYGNLHRRTSEAKKTASVPYWALPREKENVWKEEEEKKKKKEEEEEESVKEDECTLPSAMEKKDICGGEERIRASPDDNTSSACMRGSERKNSLYRQDELQQWSSTFLSYPPTFNEPAAFFRSTSTVPAPLPSWEKNNEIHFYPLSSVGEEKEEHHRTTTTTTNVFSLHIPVSVQGAVHHAKGHLLPRHRFLRSTDLYAGMSRAIPSLAEERYLAGQKKRGAAEWEKTIKDNNAEGEENNSSPSALAFPSVLESLRGTREVSDTKRPLSPSPSLGLLKHRHGCGGDIRMLPRRSSTSNAEMTVRERSSPSVRSTVSVSATPSFHSRASSKSPANRRQAKTVSSTLIRAQTHPQVLSVPSHYVHAPPLPVCPLSLSVNAHCSSETSFTSTQESRAAKKVTKTEVSNPHSEGSLTPSKEYSEMLRFLKRRLYRRKPRGVGSPGVNSPRKKKGMREVGA